MLLDDPAGDFCPRVAGGLGSEIIGAAVDDHGAAYDVTHLETVGQHRQPGSALPGQQSRGGRSPAWAGWGAPAVS